MTDLRKIAGSPLEISQGATIDHLRGAMEGRHRMINAIMDIANIPITGKEATEEMRQQISKTVDLLNAACKSLTPASGALGEVMIAILMGI